MYTGTSGLANMGNAMQVIGDNVANVNTVGFKSKSFTFSDVLSQSVATQSGSAQVGRGMAMGSIIGTFEQGAFESTGNTTDLSIGGDGFFVVRQEGTENNYYTRAGNFSFDKDGYLVNPEGYIVQGWTLNGETGDEEGSITDIVLDSFTSPPLQTDQMTMIANLDANAESETMVLSNTWDGTATPPIDAANYEYMSVVPVYDSLGSTHDVTVYYDKKSDNEWEYIVTCDPEEDKRSLVQGTAAAGLLAKGSIEFNENGSISDITMNEMTGVVGNLQGDLAETATVTLNDSSGITDETLGIVADYDAAGGWSITDPSGIYTVSPSPSSNDEKLYISVNGSGKTDITIDFSEDVLSGQSLTFDVNAPDDEAVDGGKLNVQDVQNIIVTPAAGSELSSENTRVTINNPEVITNDLAGLTLDWDAGAGSWTLSGLTDPPYTGALGVISSSDEKVAISLDSSGDEDIVFELSETLQDGDRIEFDLIGTTAWSPVEVNASGYYEFSADFLGGEAGTTMMNIEYDIGSRYDGAGSFVNDSLSTTQYSKSSSTTFQSANGYGAGDLEGVDVSADGIMTGIYSNGELIPLYRVGLAKFQNNQGLFSEGGNLYRETRDSGAAVTNKPGENGLGSISPNSLELSNVDISDQLVKMITTQRGYQANSKIITTVDEMLSETISMKR
jgi:flagellar hook protein FlgE